MNTYRPKHFALVELVPPDLFKERGERCWEWLDPAALRTADTLRKIFGPITINDWSWGGRHTERGLRRFNSTTGAEFSMHKKGGANDCEFKNATPKEVFIYILAHPDEFPLLTTLEDVDKTVFWLHFDVRNHGREGIWVVNP